MYNRYIPRDVSYTPVAEPPANPRRPSFHLPELFGEKEGLSGLLGSLHLDKIDSGDVLLLLIMLYLLVEGDDLELVIALGLVLLMGLGEGGET